MSNTLTAEEELFYKWCKEHRQIPKAMAQDSTFESISMIEFANYLHKEKVESITDEWIENDGKEGGLMHSEKQGVAGELQIYIEGGQAVKQKLLEQ